MIKRLAALAILFLLFALAGGADAEGATIVCPAGCSHPYQRWVDEARVPTPDVALSVIESPCPDGLAAACTQPTERIIWDGATTDIRESFLHEVGHNFDAYDLPEWARARYQALVGYGGEWGAEPNGPVEGFATTYAFCAMEGGRPAEVPALAVRRHGGEIRRGVFGAICRMIARVG